MKIDGGDYTDIPYKMKQNLGYEEGKITITGKNVVISVQDLMQEPAVELLTPEEKKYDNYPNAFTSLKTLFETHKKESPATVIEDTIQLSGHIQYEAKLASDAPQDVFPTGEWLTLEEAARQNKYLEKFKYGFTDYTVTIPELASQGAEIEITYKIYHHGHCTGDTETIMWDEVLPAGNAYYKATFSFTGPGQYPLNLTTIADQYLTVPTLQEDMTSRCGFDPMGLSTRSPGWDCTGTIEFTSPQEVDVYYRIEDKENQIDPERDHDPDPEDPTDYDPEEADSTSIDLKIDGQDYKTDPYVMGAVSYTHLTLPTT